MIFVQMIEFRMRHWGSAKEYIPKYSNHPRATGGGGPWQPGSL